MKSVTEFWSVNLNKGLKARTELTAGGKTPEEIQTAIGESFKMEGDRLKHFLNAMEVASQNPDKLAQVLVVTVAEGETAPPKAVKIEETHYIPVFMAEARKVNTEKFDRQAANKGKKREGGVKTSPWGLTPEEKAAKKGGVKKDAPKPQS
jgi:hypothetical protein